MKNKDHAISAAVITRNVYAGTNWLGFVVPGRAAPKGSTRSFVSRTTGRVVTLTDSARLRDWTQQVAFWAARAKGTKAPKGASVTVYVNFVRCRPRSQRATRPSVRPDLDKLLRALLDALTGVAYDDDAQVCHLRAQKTWGERDETIISVSWEA